MQECTTNHQPLIFAGMDAHHQNQIAEHKICELQEMAQFMIIHAAKQWPKTVTTHLWPYAIRMAARALKKTPSFQDGERCTPEQIFSKT